MERFILSSALKTIIQTSLKFTPLVFVAVIAIGCGTATDTKKMSSFPPTKTNTKVVIMPLDVELSKLTTAGLLEPQAEWTQNAIDYLKTSISQKLSAADTNFSFYEKLSDDPRSNLVQLQKLHQEIGNRVMIHEVGMLKLPTKKDKALDWSLGSKASDLRTATNADYALFVFIRDSYSTGGRKALIGLLAVASMGNVIVSGGQQVGFASLVDLNTGDLVWFNRLFNATSGDLRQQETSDQTVSALLSGFPE